MEWEIDYTNYSYRTKYTMDIENGKESWAKPKLNKGNKLYDELDKVVYSGDEFIMPYNNNERKDTDNVEQQNSELLQQRNDRLRIYDSSNPTKEGTQGIRFCN